jgi:hypothetical protein
MGTLPKKSLNLSASMVADVTINFKSCRRDITSRKRLFKKTKSFEKQTQSLFTQKEHQYLNYVHVLHP